MFVEYRSKAYFYQLKRTLASDGPERGRASPLSHRRLACSVSLKYNKPDSQHHYFARQTPGGLGMDSVSRRRQCSTLKIAIG